MLFLILSLLLASGRAQAPASPRPATVLREDPAVTALARKIYSQMRTGKVDEMLLTEEMNKALSPEVLAQTKPVFDQLGDPVKLTLESGERATEGIRWVYLAVFPTAQLHVKILVGADGKVGGYSLAP
jgi:hypothetical protein